MATMEQKKKHERRLLIMLGGVVAAIMLTLVVGLSGGGDDELPTRDILQDSVLQATQEIVHDISIPRDFFEQRLLDSFKPYTPVELPQTYGRANPFISQP